MSSLSLTDILLVNRGGQSYKLQLSDMADILDDDLLLVNRGGSSYKITGNDFKNSVISIQPGANDINISPTVTGSGTLGDPFILTLSQIGPWGASTQCAETITINGQAAATAVIWTDLSASASGARFEQPDSITNSSGVWTGKLVYNDTPSSTAQTTYVGNIKIGSLYFRWNVQQNETNTRLAVIGSASITENDVTGARYTSQAFTANITMTDEGLPTSDKKLKGYVEGSLNKYAETDEITNVVNSTVDGTWTSAGLTGSYPAGLTNAWTSVAYGNNVFVAVGDNGDDRVMYSSNGTSWTGVDVSAVDSGNNWKSVAFGHGYFVAVGSGGSTSRGMYSTDGINWTALPNFKDSHSYYAVVAGPDNWVATNSNNVIVFTNNANATNPSLADWYQQTLPTPAINYSYLTYGDDKFVAISTAGDCMYASDPTVYMGWSTSTLPTNPEVWWDLTYGDDKFVAMANEGELFAWSTDASTWNSVTVSGADDMGALTYGDGKFVAVAKSQTAGLSMVSTDAINWTFGDINSTLGAYSWDSVAYGGGKFAAVASGAAMYSTSGTGRVENLSTLTLTTDQDLTDFSAGDTVSQDSGETVTADTFSTTLYNGNSSTNTINTGIDNTDKSLVWLKLRTSLSNQEHKLYDSLRGTESTLRCNDTDSEDTDNIFDEWSTSGFTLDTSQHAANRTSNTYVCWNFRAAAKFFDIVTYTGSGSAQTIDHSLACEPGMIIVKNRTTATNWEVYHVKADSSSPQNYKLEFNESVGVSSNSGPWDNTPPTSSVFTVGTNNSASGDSYVAYLFAEDEDVIKCGSFTGNGSTQEIDIGFKPQWVLIKKRDGSDSWNIWDAERNNGSNTPRIDTNSANTEQLDYDSVLFNDSGGWSGFSLSSNDAWNGSNKEYIYVAINEDSESGITTIPSGLVQSTDTTGPTMTVETQVSGWSANTDNYVKGDTEIAAAKLWTVLSANGQVTSLTGSDPGYTTMAGNPNYTLTFPATFPSGDAPDTDLPVGTTIKLDVRASNTAGNADVTTSALTPVYNGEFVEDMFITYTYEGNGSTMTITNGIDLVGEGGLVWTKDREHTYEHSLVNTVTGVNSVLQTNATAAELTYEFVSGFNSDGYGLASVGAVTNNNHDFVSWTFRKAPGFFDVVTWSGNDTTRTIEHGLACVPGSIWVKHLNGTGPWLCYHKSLGNTKNIELQSTNDEDTNAAMWNNTDPTSTHFTLGTNSNVNGTGRNFVAYLFADGDDADAQIFGNAPGGSIIKCGSYTPSGSDLQVDCGWEPQWLMVKDKDSGTVWKNWGIFDNMRGVITDGNDTPLAANATTEEGGTYLYGSDNIVEFNANGFLVKNGISLAGTSGHTFIYVAVRRGPMQTPEDATKVFSINEQSSGSGGGGVSFPLPSFPLDMIIAKRADNSADWKVFDRLRGYDRALTINNTDIESGESVLAGLDQMSGYTVGSNGGVFNHSDVITYSFRRAPGFFEMVCYEGNGAQGYDVPHNLGVAPEMIIIKARSLGTENWKVYAAPLGNTYAMTLDTTYAKGNASINWWDNTTPDESKFRLGDYDHVNKNTETYIAYLFASCPGVSKVGAYDGSLDPINIDCGFTGDARFVMIKATSRTGEWHVWDTTRGINTGNSPFLYMDKWDSQYTGTDFIDPYTGGFSVVGAGTNDGAINAVGESYIYLAIA